MCIRNEMIFYRIYSIKNHFIFIQFKNERLTEILQAVRCLIFFYCIITTYQFIVPFLDDEMFGF